jgi:hypothetical protein
MITTMERNLVEPAKSRPAGDAGDAGSVDEVSALNWNSKSASAVDGRKVS